jgi:hypothetical protein
MATLASVAAKMQENEAVYRKIAEQSLALSRITDQQWATVGESMKRYFDTCDRQTADLGRQLAAMNDVSKMIDPSVFSAGARVQEALAASSLARFDTQITEMARRVMDAYDVTAWQRQLALDVSRWPLAQFEASIGAYLKHIDDIPRRLGADVLASLDAFNQRQWEMLQAAVLPRMDEIFAAAAAVGSVDDLVPDEFIDVEVDSFESGDDRQAVPQVLTRFQVIVIAYIMTMAIWFFSLGEEGLTREQLQQDTHAFAVGVLGALTILLLNRPIER